MKLTCILVAAACFLAPAQALAAEPSQPLGADSLWAWHWDSPGELTQFVRENGLSRVYLYCEGGFDRKVRRAVAALGAAGIEVEALGGESRWATTQRSDMLRFVRSAIRYQRSAPAGARLAGIHLDVEPYGLPAWDRDQRGTARSLARSLGAARRAAGPLPVSADIPFWFDEISGISSGSRVTLAEAIMRATDATTVMAYRDSGGDAIDVARREVRIAGRLGKATTIGVETGAVSPEQVTFFEEGRIALEEALAEVQSRFAPDPGFGGVAVHHYESLRSLG